MSNYAIGDIQGCFGPLTALLQQIHFDEDQDHLWLVGDLVNRGPDSLTVLRWAKNLGPALHAVLGNHDLHLLRVATGIATPRPNDTLAEVLCATDSEELIAWLRQLPLIQTYRQYLFVHAGLLPQWSVEEALTYAHEVERALQGADYPRFLSELYGDTPNRWRDDLTGMDRLRVITNACTRLRFCTAEGEMEFKNKGGPDSPPQGYMPWYKVPQRATKNIPVVFGHWSALGLKIDENIVALDSGCCWGNQLSALRLEDGQIFQVNCPAR